MELHTLMKYADVIRSTETNATVARLMDNGNVIVGTARSVGNETGGFARATDNVEELFLRVTAHSGWEYFWPLAELVEDYNKGKYAPDYTG